MWPFDDILGAVNGLFQFFIALIELLFYWPLSAFQTFYNVAVTHINVLITFANCFITLYNTLKTGLFDAFQGVYFDSIVGWLFAASLLIVLIFRVYYYAKDVEILGNKI